MTTRCTVPAKLILSGEHAVLYGVPALSLAIDLPTRCTIEHLPTTDAQTTPLSFTANLTDFAQSKTLSAEQWLTRVDEIKHRFKLFKQGKLSIDQVLKTPFDLIWVTLDAFYQHHHLASGTWKIHIESDSLIGRGLGSSAAVIVSLLSALKTQHGLALSKQQLLSLSKEVETYQHGRSSGVDPATLIYAGLLKYRMDAEPVPLAQTSSLPLPAWLIDTGRPQSGTGECVEFVKRFTDDANLWGSFAQVEEQIEQAWSENNTAGLKEGIRMNQRLLKQVGVVPNSIDGFIQRLENDYDAAVKVCGAGAIYGASAGILLCLSDQDPTELCQQNHYRCYRIQSQSHGVQCETLN